MFYKFKIFKKIIYILYRDGRNGTERRFAEYIWFGN